MRASAKASCLLILATGLSVAAPVVEVLTPERYFKCLLAAQRATIQGLEERAAVTAEPTATDAQKRLAGELIGHRVTLALDGCGKQDGATIGAYAHRNASALQAWLNANPQVKDQLEAQRRRISSFATR